MLKSFAKELLKLVILLFVASFVVFLLVGASPIDPLTSNYGQAAVSQMSDEKIAALQSYWGLNTPILERYFNWLTDALTLNFGTSLIYNEPVVTVIARGLARSSIMLLFAWIFSGIFGYLLGILAGSNEGKLSDKIVSIYCYAISSTPTFWIALIALMVFGVYLGWFPIGFSTNITTTGGASAFELIYHATLPALVLSFVGVAQVCMHTRAKTIEVMSSDYVFLAQMQGKSKREIMCEHVLKNVSLPFISIEFAQVGEIIGGSVLVEQVFSYPGLGNIIVNAAVGSDASLLVGVSLVCVAIVFVGNIICDIIVRLVDPRIKNV